MMLKIQRFAWCLLFLSVAAAPMAAADNASSREKARQALSVLQSDAPPQDKALACKRLAIYGTAEAVPALASLLSDEKLAAWARIALQVIPGPAADEALRGAMGKLQGRLLVGVINSIGVRKDTQAVEGLVARLKDADPEVASAAAVALGKIGGDPAVQALERFLPDAPVAVRAAAAEGCIRCAEQLLAAGQTAAAVKLYDAVRTAGGPKQSVLEGTRGAILARQSEGLPLLFETLRSTDKAVFGVGLRTARELPGRAVTEALAAELGRTAPDRQGTLLLALADRQDPAALPAVFAAAQAGPKELRLVAIAVMDRLGNVACLPVLLEMAATSDADLSKAAKNALGRLPAKDVDEQLCARLPKVTGHTRRELVDLAGQRRVTAAVPELIKASRDADPAVRKAGIKALGETVSAADLGALTDLLAGATSDEDVAAVQAALEAACTRLPDKMACADRLLACLPTSATPARCALLRVLGVVATPGALQAVTSALASQEPSVRDTAVRALADWPEPPALPALFGVFRSTQNETHRVLALRNCVRLLDLGGQTPEQTLKTYGELLANARRVEDRKMVLAGLAGVAHPGALKLVEPLLAEPEVQAEAELAMLSIASGMMGSAPNDAKAMATRLQAQSKNQATRDRAAQILRQAERVEDFITVWQMAGAYTEIDQGGPLFDTAFAPEWAGNKVAWRPLPSGTQAARPWMLDLLAALTGERRVAYARTWIHSDKPQTARIEFGTDDGNKLWFNGKIVHEANRGGAAVPGDFKAPVQLRQGWNALLLKVIQDTGPWEFCLRLRTAEGGKLEGLRAQATPPAEQ
jgi:HEAT repeat protein